MDQRRVIWPEGRPEEAVTTHGLLDRWWTQWRMGWLQRRPYLRPVHTAQHFCPVVDEIRGYCGYDEPVKEAERWEEFRRAARRYQ